MKKITSTKNSIITEVAKYKNTKVRKNSGLFCAEGYKLTEELISCGLKPVYHFVLENTDLSKYSTKIDTEIVYFVSEAVMKKISTMATPPEILTVARQNNVFTDYKSDDLILALDCIQDPSNIGAMLRSAEAFGVKTVLLGEGCCDAYSQKALRAAMGSTFRLNIIEVNMTDSLIELKNNGFTIIGTGLDRNYQTVDKLCNYNKKVIVIGNEGSGISKQVQNCCDFGMFIPMSGSNESLNASVAASIIMWENQRQKNE